MLEKTIQKKILDYLSKEPETFVMKSIIMNMRGIPDIIICHRGQFVYIEVKSSLVDVRSARRASKLQLQRMQDLDNCGALGFITNDFHEFLQHWARVKEVINKIKNPTNVQPFTNS